MIDTDIDGFGRVLIVCYSYTGNTYKIAREIQSQTGGDLCELFPRSPYPTAFPELLAQVRSEIRRKYRLCLLPTACSPSDYDSIFIGSPNWCGTIAPPVSEWLSRNRTMKKTLFPFCSHCGGTAGNMARDVSALCPGAAVYDGLSVINDGGDILENDVRRWLERLNRVFAAAE